MSLDGGRAAMPSDSQARYAIATVTAVGKDLALTLREKLGEEIPIYTTPRLADDRVIAIEGRVIEALGQLFQEVDVLICIMAIGAVVRAIAPVLKDKASDPAVVVMDEKATNVISLLSGHLGGANQVTRDIAELLGSNPVITTECNSLGQSGSVGQWLAAGIARVHQTFQQLSRQRPNRLFLSGKGLGYGPSRSDSGG